MLKPKQDILNLFETWQIKFTMATEPARIEVVDHAVTIEHKKLTDQEQKKTIEVHQASVARFKIALVHTVRA